MRAHLYDTVRLITNWRLDTNAACVRVVKSMGDISGPQHWRDLRSFAQWSELHRPHSGAVNCWLARRPSVVPCVARCSKRYGAELKLGIDTWRHISREAHLQKRSACDVLRCDHGPRRTLMHIRESGPAWEVMHSTGLSLKATGASPGATGSAGLARVDISQSASARQLTGS